MPKLTRKQIVKKLAKSDEDYNLCYENALLSLRSKAIRLGYINERHPERSNIKKYQRYEMKWLPTVIRLHARRMYEERRKEKKRQKQLRKENEFLVKRFKMIKLAQDMEKWILPRDIPLKNSDLIKKWQ